jgi:hypothetical protein
LLAEPHSEELEELLLPGLKERSFSVDRQMQTLIAEARPSEPIPSYFEIFFGF